jgi:segregation and condensation protein B
MAKRKKSKQHPKSRQVADPGTEQSETAAEAVADVASGASETESASEPAAENDQVTEPIVETAQTTAAETTPSEMVSDATATEQLADASGEVEKLETDAHGIADEPTADASSAAGEPQAARATGKKGKQRSKNKKGGGKQATVSKDIEAEEPVSPDAEATSAPSDDADLADQGDQPAPFESNSDEISDTSADAEDRPAVLAAEVDGENADGLAEAPTEASDETAMGSEFDSTWKTDDEGSPREASADAGEDAAASETSAEGNAATDQVTAEADTTAAEAETEGDEQGLEGHRLESIIESLLFASDKALSLSDLRRLLGERDGKKITAAIQSLIQKRMDTGIQVVTLSTGWHLRTSVDNATWVSKLLVGKPVRLSRAMMETLAIVAYRQPVTRPEVDDIRGVDCGPVLKTLLERGLVRIIGKKEEVGRPMLYGTTPEFLRVFNLRDLTELPTLREFYDLSAEDQTKVDAEAPPPSAITAKPDVALNSVSRGALAPEAEDADPLLDELDAASDLAKKALGELEPKPAPDQDKSEEPDAAASAETKNEPESTPAGE